MTAPRQSLEELRKQLEELHADYPERLTVTEVAEILGYTRQQVHLKVVAGELPGFQTGPRKWLFFKQHILDVLLAGASSYFTDAPSGVDP